MIFGKKVRGGKALSIGEERAYLKKKSRARKATIAEQVRLGKLDAMNKTKNVFGKVFITKAKVFGDTSPWKGKTRRAVAIKADGRGMTLAPITRSGPILPLSGFDGERKINLNEVRNVDMSQIYEKNKFIGTSRDKLTRRERHMLLKKILARRAGRK